MFGDDRGVYGETGDGCGDYGEGANYCGGDYYICVDYIEEGDYVCASLESPFFLLLATIEQRRVAGKKIIFL